MITPVKGIKKQVFGGMLVCLGAITALLARILGFELDIFYVVISVIGVCLFLYGAIQKKQQEKPVRHRSIDRATQPLLIRHGEVLTPVRPEPVEGCESIHISTSSMRTDFKHNLAGSIVISSQKDSR